MAARVAILIAAALVVARVSTAAAQQNTLDYTYFKNRVEPIFLQKREGHTSNALLCLP